MDKRNYYFLRPIERLLKHPNTDIGLAASYINFKKIVLKLKTFFCLNSSVNTKKYELFLVLTVW